MSDVKPNCGLCGEPMPDGEKMFKYHGYSGPCPKPRLPKPQAMTPQETQRRADCFGDLVGALEDILDGVYFEKKNSNDPRNVNIFRINARAALAKAEAL